MKRQPQRSLRWSKIQRELGLEAAPRISLLWLAVAGMAIRYFQLAIQIERQYDYLHALEAAINNHYPEGSIAFAREGVSCNSEYPIFSLWLHHACTKVFPVLLCLIAIANICNEIWPET